MLKLFCFFLFHTSRVWAHINRMECSYDANFTIMDTNKYHSGTISTTVHNVNKTECVTCCFTHDICAFVNFKLDETECQLMTDDQSGTYGDEVRWEFVSTDYRTIRVGQSFVIEMHATIDIATMIAIQINNTSVMTKVSSMRLLKLFLF